MVEFVAGDEVGEGADGHFFFVGEAAAHPGCSSRLRNSVSVARRIGDVIFDRFGERALPKGALRM